MPANKFAGSCKCGVYVAAGTGSIGKVRGRWEVTCAACASEAESKEIGPQREMVGCIYWPNGMGYTECSEEYEAAHSVMMSAKGAFDDIGGESEGGGHPDFRKLCNAYYEASNAFGNLQCQPGHLGERIRFDAPDPMTALLGGGRITIAPGGVVGIAD